MLTILSLGAGVQSSALALMMEKGIVDRRPDAAIFADTQREPQAVYEHLTRLETLLTYPVYRVTKGDLGSLEIKTRRSGSTGVEVSIPAYTLMPDGTRGMVSRQCTKNYKILQITKKISEIVGKDALRSWRSSQDKQPLVRQVIGISLDESSRMKPSRTAWIENVYPLVDYNLTRDDCDEWFFAKTGWHAPRSACVFCPFHDDTEWLALTESEMAYAVAYEKKLQEAVAGDGRLDAVPYLHSSRVPLDKVRFKRRRVFRQGNLLNQFDNECEGMCGV